MKSIWKYPLLIEREQIVKLPKNTEILNVMVYQEAPYLWVSGNYFEEDEERTILTRESKEVLTEDIKGVSLGTYKLVNKGPIYNVFEKL